MKYKYSAIYAFMPSENGEQTLKFQSFFHLFVQKKEEDLQSLVLNKVKGSELKNFEITA